MRRFLIASAAAVVLLGTLEILRADAPDKPSDTRSYTQGYMPYLGGAYRNPDAYLPDYPGYAPYWQSAPNYYLYPYPLYYQYPLYLTPRVYSRGQFHKH
jgi:hypothetical protein